MTLLPDPAALTFLLAQTADAGAEGPPPWTMFIYFGLFAAVMYFVLIRPQQVMKKKQEELIGGAKSGDRVTTNGGIVGTVTNVREHTFLIRVAPNVKIEILKTAIASVDKKEGKDAPAEEPEDEADDDTFDETEGEAVASADKPVPRNRSKKKRR